MNVYANFGKLEEGTYKVKVSATSGKEKDSIEFPFDVKTSQQEIAVKAISSIDKLKNITPSKNPIVLEFYKSGFSDYMRYLDILVDTNEDRLDTRIAYYKALEYENKYYGYNYPISISDMNKFNNAGILRYLENETNSYEVTALVSYYYPSLYKLDSSIYYEELGKTNSFDVAIDNLLVLSAMKKPVLDELNFLNDLSISDNLFVAKLALAYAFIGDYNHAKEIYRSIKNTNNIDGIIAILSTFVDKDNAVNLIDKAYSLNKSDRYVYFAMISFFDNNEANLNKESTVKVFYKDQKEEIHLKGLMMKKIKINNKDLNTLKISSTDSTDMINYYYEGGFSELDENNIFNNIFISLSNNDLYVGNVVNIRFDLSNLKNVSGNLKIYLPNCMRLSGNINSRGVYLAANRGEYLVISVSNEHDNYIDVPVYLSYPGNYKIEEAIMKIKENYYVSNSIDVNIK